MAYVSTSPSNSAIASNGVSNLWETLGQRFAQYRLYAKTVRELQDLSERELNDLGIARCEIRHIAHEAAYGG